MFLYMFATLSGHAEQLGQGEQQPAGPGVPEAGCPGTSGGDGPAALQAGRDAQRRQAKVPGRVPNGQRLDLLK